MHAMARIEEEAREIHALRKIVTQPDRRVPGTVSGGLSRKNRRGYQNEELAIRMETAHGRTPYLYFPYTISCLPVGRNVFGTRLRTRDPQGVIAKIS